MCWRRFAACSALVVALLPVTAAAQNPMDASRLILGPRATPITFRSGSGSPEGVVTSPVNGQYYDWTTGEKWRKATGAGSTGWVKEAGTVTSITLTVPSILSASGCTITTSGTCTLTLATQTANTLFAGPTTGSAAAPTFRAMVLADIPDGLITNAKVNASAAIDWTKISKSGSSLADLATRSASDLSTGTLADARLEATIDVVTAINAPVAALTTIELGHATDTTFSRVSGGVGAIEGNTLAMLGSAAPFTALVSSTAGFAVNATGRYYLDGVAGTGDTYLTEESDGVVKITANGTAIFRIDANGLILPASQYLAIDPGQYIWLDGGVNTGINESSADVMSFKVGGTDRLTISTTVATAVVPITVNDTAPTAGTQADILNLFSSTLGTTNGEAWLNFGPGGGASDYARISANRRDSGANQATALGFWTRTTGAVAERWRITENGHFIAVADNTYDIGASGATRPRTGYFGTSVTTPIVTAAANLTLSPVGDLITDPAGNDILPVTNYDINIGAINLKYKGFHGAELWVETIVAQETAANIGGRILVGQTTILEADIADTAGTTGTTGGMITASAGVSNSGGPACMVDGVLEQNCFHVDAAAPGDTITVDYGAGNEKLVTLARVYEASGGTSAAVWRLERSEDGAAWSTVCTMTSLAAGWNQCYTTGSQTAARYWRYYLTNTPGAGAWSGEIELIQEFVVSLKHNSFGSGAGGDVVYMESAGKVEFFHVNEGPSGAGPYSYYVTRNIDASTRNAWYAGDAMFSTGTTGDGFIDIRSVRGVKSPAESGSAIVGNVRLSPAYNDWAPRWAIGDLNGLCGYSASTYGAFFGDCSAAWVKIDPTNGVRLGHASTSAVEITPAGVATFQGVGTGLTAINGGNIQTNTVTAAQIAADAITASELAADSVTSAKILANTIVAADIAANTLTAAEIAADAITTSELAADSVTSAKIVAGTIVASDIATSTITADRMSVSQLSAIAADLGTITAASVTVGASGYVRQGQTAYGTGTGFWLGTDGGTPKLSVGTAAGNRFNWDGTDLTLVSSSVSIGSTGITIVTPLVSSISTTHGYKFTPVNAAGASFGMFGHEAASGGGYLRTIQAVNYVTGSTDSAAGNYGVANSTSKFSGMVVSAAAGSGATVAALYGETIMVGNGYADTTIRMDGLITGATTTRPRFQFGLDFTTGSSYRKLAVPSYMGYSSTYKAIVIGSTSTTYNVDDGAVTLAFNYSPSDNTGGSFSGDGTEIIFRNGTKFLSPNSGDTDFVNLFRLDGTNARIQLDPSVTRTTFDGILLHVGGSSSYGGSGGLNLLGFGYTSSTKVPASFGFITTSTAGNTKGDFVWALREVTTDTAPTEKMRLSEAGALTAVSTIRSNSGFNTNGTAGLASTVCNPTAGNMTVTGGLVTACTAADPAVHPLAFLDPVWSELAFLRAEVARLSTLIGGRR